jgi:hypothetical protein
MTPVAQMKHTSQGSFQTLASHKIMKQKSNNRLTGLGWLVFICMTFPVISTAQTNLTIETAIKIEYPTVITNAYMLETSTNLVDWTPPSSYSQRWQAGYGFPVTRFFEIENEKLYFRVRAVPRPDAVDYTIPATDAIDVDPAITNLIVTFTTDMNTNGISFSSLSLLFESPFPYEQGDFGTWIDSKTYMRKMSLQTNTQYYAEIVFETTDGIPALPLVLTFTTRE